MQFSFFIICILKKEPRQGGKDSWAGEEAVVVGAVAVVAAPALDTDGTMAPVITITIPAQNMVAIMDPEMATEKYDYFHCTTIAY